LAASRRRAIGSYIVAKRRVCAKSPGGAGQVARVRWRGFKRRSTGTCGRIVAARAGALPVDAVVAAVRGRYSRTTAQEDRTMSEHIYKHLELTGSSKASIEDAVGNAIAKAHETVRNIQWFTIKETRGHVVDGKVAHWQVTINVGFTLE